MQAIIIGIDLDRGFCFARINGTGRDVFVHAKTLHPPLVLDESLIGERVDVDVIDTDRGYRATAVRPLIITAR